MIMTRRHAAVLACLLALPGAGRAQVRDSAGDYANLAPIPADGTAALVRFALTPDVYRGAAEADLADLRVFNGAGEALPYALYPQPAGPSEALAAVAVTVFPLPAGTPPSAAGKGGIHVETNNAGAVVRIDVGRGPAPLAGGPSSPPASYLLDASALRMPVRALDLEVQADGDYSGKVRLESSNDLAQWRTVVTDAVILDITQGAERLQRRRIEFAPQSAPYYRLAWDGMPQGARLASASAQPANLRSEPAHEWTDVPGVAGEAPGEYRFDTAAHFPADRVRIVLPEANTVAPVTVYARARNDAPWRLLARQTVYRLNRPAGEVTSPAMAVTPDADRYWRVVVDQRSGGLGAGVPRLQLAWVPQELVFAARGAPPFTLAFGRSHAAPAAIGVAALIPDYRDADATRNSFGPAGSLAGGEPAPAVQPVRVILGAPLHPVASPPDVGGATRFSAATAALWSALAAGVGLLGWMAWRLQRQMKTTPKTPPPPQTGDAVEAEQ